MKRLQLFDSTYNLGSLVENDLLNRDAMSMYFSHKNTQLPRYSPLILIASLGDAHFAELLSGAGADVSAQYASDGQKTALHVATQLADHAVVEVLLAHGGRCSLL